MWFLFRYWLVNKGEWREKYVEEMQESIPKWLLRYYFNPMFSDSVEVRTASDLDSIKYRFWSPDKKEIWFRVEIQRLGQGVSNLKNEPDGFKDWLFIKVCTAYLLMTKPTLTGYYVPYWLFFIAAYLGVADWRQGVN